MMVVLAEPDTLVDTGPVVALLDRADNHHARCVAAARLMSERPLLMTWACYTEAMYFLGQTGGWRYQATLWQMWATGGIVLHEHTAEEADRMAQVMETYQDTPCDLADASLIVAAETRNLRRVWTLDAHFYVYRFADGGTFDVVR